ncbi:MAG: hypothetical protein OSA84_00735 [Akkermansiaceae bacterium]|nr:hypothetical protein [Akkermansiaceae bacterium]
MMRSFTHTTLLTAFIFSLCSGSALADFDKGIAAYQADNLPLAYKEFLAAAEAGHADSQFNVALMFEKGMAVAKRSPINYAKRKTRWCSSTPT